MGNGQWAMGNGQSGHDIRMVYRDSEKEGDRCCGCLSSIEVVRVDVTEDAVFYHRNNKVMLQI